MGAGGAKAEDAIEAAFETVKRVHDLMSFHDAASDVSRLNRAEPGEAVIIERWTYQVLATSLDLHRRSLGCFDITVAPVLQLLGFLPSAAQDAPFAREPGASGSIALLPGNRVRIERPGTKIDLGGIAKGFAVDRAVDVLRQRGIEAGLVNAGGDLAAFGPEKHAVAIRDPRDPVRLLCHVLLKDAALASSALTFDPVRSTVVGRSAVIDPKNSQPVQEICGASVHARSCLVADALTKVVMISGASSTVVLDHYRASALLVMPNGEVETTDSWRDACSVAA